MRIVGLSGLLLLTLVVPALLSCRESKGIDSPEAALISDVIRSFILEAYGDDGDTRRAYRLLDPESRRSCTFEEFSRLATMGRNIVGFRELAVVDVRVRKIDGDRAAVAVRAEMSGRRAYFLPDDIVAVRDAGSWYYKNETDPTCDDPGAFFEFGLAAVTVTPSADCERSYPFVCIPPLPPDLDCGDIGMRGFIVNPPDPHRLDADGDGFGCNE
jgi:hypothetical protein